MDMRRQAASRAYFRSTTLDDRAQAHMSSVWMIMMRSRGASEGARGAYDEGCEHKGGLRLPFPLQTSPAPQLPSRLGGHVFDTFAHACNA